MNAVVKSSLSVLFMILFIKGSTAQDSVKRKARVIGLVPSKTERINGWAIGYLGIIESDITAHELYKPSVKINGLYTDISPLPVLTVGMGALMVIASPDTYKSIFSKDTTSAMSDSVVFTQSPDTLNYDHRMNGLMISIMEFGEDVSFHGVQISGGHYAVELKGLSIALTGSGCNRFEGVMISGLFNWVDYGSGIQIGIFNRAYRMKGIQIGLWNKIGKRGLPLINVSF